MKKNISFAIIIALVLFAAVPSALADTQKAAGEYLGYFVKALTELFNGHSDAFVRNFTNSFPLIAVFLIVLGLVQYVSRTVIFKNEGGEKYATILAVGMALLTVWSRPAFNWIMNLGTTTVFIIFGFVMVAFLVQGATAHRTALGGYHLAGTDMMNNHTSFLGAFDANKKARQESYMQDQLEHREKTGLENARKDIDDFYDETKDVEAHLTKILGIIKNLRGARNEGNASAYMNSLRQQLNAVNAHIIVNRRDFSGIIGHLREVSHTNINEKTHRQSIKNQINREIANFNKNTTNSQMRAEKIQRISAARNLVNEIDSLNNAELNLIREFAPLERIIQRQESELIAQIQMCIATVTQNPPAAEKDINVALGIAHQLNQEGKKMDTLGDRFNALVNQEHAFQARVTNILGSLKP
ncbi:MAG: hypothetical protein NTV63_01625 [Candidatus Woesearchaeota archaeon]|nr:hypothetical protein [Candidatus Woesearchaeota archaeon]